MKPDTVTKSLLAVIAVLLAIIAARPLVSPAPARAAVDDSTAIYIEPGTTNLRSPDGSRNVIGKVVVDLNNGNVWGFPTLTTAPYPLDATKPTPPVSHPFYLGRYDFAAMRRGAE